MVLLTSEFQGIKVVHVRDLSDTESVVEFRDTLARLVSQSTIRLILDLCNAGHINSMGIGVMVSVLKRVNQGGGRLILEAPRDNVCQLFRILGLDKIFTIAKNRHDALETLGLTEEHP